MIPSREQLEATIDSHLKGFASWTDVRKMLDQLFATRAIADAEVVAACARYDEQRNEDRGEVGQWSHYRAIRAALGGPITRYNENSQTND